MNKHIQNQQPVCPGLELRPNEHSDLERPAPASASARILSLTCSQWQPAQGSAGLCHMGGTRGQRPRQPYSSQGENLFSNPFYSLQTRNTHFYPTHPDLHQPGLRVSLGASLRTPWPQLPPWRQHCSGGVGWLGPAAPASGSAAGPGWPRWGAGSPAGRGPRRCSRW